MKISGNFSTPSFKKLYMTKKLDLDVQTISDPKKQHDLSQIVRLIDKVTRGKYIYADYFKDDKGVIVREYFPEMQSTRILSHDRKDTLIGLRDAAQRLEREYDEPPRRTVSIYKAPHTRRSTEAANIRKTLDKLI